MKILRSFGNFEELGKNLVQVIWESFKQILRTPLQTTWTEQVENENEGSEHGTTSARVHYVWAVCGDLFPNCEVENGGRNSQRINANVWRELYQYFKCVKKEKRFWKQP